MLDRSICVDNECKLYSAHAFYRAEIVKQTKTWMNFRRKATTTTAAAVVEKERTNSWIKVFHSVRFIWYSLALAKENFHTLHATKTMQKICQMKKIYTESWSVQLKKHLIKIQSIYICVRTSDTAQCVEESAINVYVCLHRLLSCCIDVVPQSVYIHSA